MRNRPSRCRRFGIHNLIRERGTHMSSGEIFSCSTSTRSSSTSFDSPRSSTPSRQDLLNGPISSAQSDGAPKSRTIAIAVKAHKEMRSQPFIYAFNHLVEQKNCKVVVICCLSRIQDEMGVDHTIDVEVFGGINNRKLETAINKQIDSLNHFLKSFQKQLEQRGVQLDIRISAGPKSEDILVQAAKAIHPHWVVLDAPFSRNRRKIQERLECNLVLVKQNSKPLILQLRTKYLAPIEQLDVEEDRGDWCPTPTTTVGSEPAAISTSVDVSDTTTTTTTTTNSKVFAFCMCFNGKVAEEGPTKETTFLYGNTIPGSKVAYLGKVGNQSIQTEERLVIGTVIESPSSSPAPWFNNTSSRKSVRIIEQELHASMITQAQENDRGYDMQL